MKRNFVMAAALTGVLALSSFAFAAKLIYSDTFDGNLSKWAIGVDQVALSGQAAIFKGLGKTGTTCLEFQCVEGVGDGTNMFLPFMDMKEGYVEAWLYDKTGGRDEFVDQAYLVVGGPGGEAAGTGWVQLGQDGNPGRTEDQTRYSLLAGNAWLTDVATRSKGWHKFGFELKAGTVRLYIDDKLQGEVDDPAFATIGVVGFLSYYGAERAGAIGEPIHQAYWDDLKIYDSKP